MNSEQFPNQEQENKRKALESLSENVLQNKGENIPTIEYNLPYPKDEFLKFLTEKLFITVTGLEGSIF